MMSSTLVSIIVPIYNVGDYVEDCIKSLINQTFRNIEIILVNDGSKDNSLSICRKYESIDPRITVINQENQGVSVARNAGINISKGEWICFVDGDDWVEENMVEELVKVTKHSNSDIIMCGAFKDTISNSSKFSFFDKENYVFEDCDKLILQRQAIIHLRGEYNPYMRCGVPWSKLYRKSFIEKNKIRFSKKYIKEQDMIFNLYAFEYANSIEYINKPLYHYRVNNNSVTKKTDINALDKLKASLEGIKDFIDYKQINKNSILEAYNVKALYTLDSGIYNLILCKNPTYTYNQLKKIIDNFLTEYNKSINEINTIYLSKMGKIKRFLLLKHINVLYIILMKGIVYIKYRRLKNTYY